MKNQKIFNYCENCDKEIEDKSPPHNEQYEQGIIHIEKGSTVLLSEEIAKCYDNHHSKSITGYYCDFNCLNIHIKTILTGEQKPHILK